MLPSLGMMSHDDDPALSKLSESLTCVAPSICLRHARSWRLFSWKLCSFISYHCTCAPRSYSITCLFISLKRLEARCPTSNCQNMTKQRSILTLILLSGILDATSAFSPPGASSSAPRTRPADTTERNYGAHSDIEFSVTESSPDFESLVQLTMDKTNQHDKPKRRQHKVMIRPKSLTSRILKNDVQKEEMFPQLLSREEEAQISNAIRKLRAAIRVRDDLVSNHLNPQDSEFPWQPTETEWALACGMSVMQLRRVMNDGQEARTKLVDANGGLVNSIAMKHFYSVKQANQAGGGLGSILNTTRYDSRGEPWSYGGSRAI